MPVLVIHGGAGARNLTAARVRLYSESLLKVLDQSYPILARGGTSLAAVAKAVEILEDDPLYNAGRGSKIQSDGRIRMSASIMDNASRRFGGCVNVEGVKNPIRLARALMKRKDRVLSGLGAERFARALGLPFASPYTPEQVAAHRRRRKGKSGTVGAVAMDRKRTLAAATSTGGRGYEFPFRVSDSPTVAGNFAGIRAAVSATGTGEEIVENGTAAAVCSLVEAGWSLRRAVQHVLKKSKTHGGEFGLIAIDKNGNWLAETNTRSLLWAATDGKTCVVMGRKI